MSTAERIWRLAQLTPYLTWYQIVKQFIADEYKNQVQCWLWRQARSDEYEEWRKEAQHIFDLTDLDSNDIN